MYFTEQNALVFSFTLIIFVNAVKTKVLDFYICYEGYTV